MVSVIRARLKCAFVAASTALAAMAVPQAADAELPRVMVWTAYDVGSTGYNQAIGFGSVFKNELGTTLRVLPGKNDVSRLAPLISGKADYSLTGTSDVLWAQEGMYAFGTQQWGPQPISQVITNISNAGPTLATTQKTGIKTIEDIRGRRVAWVVGAPSLQQSTRAVLAFGGLTLDDVVLVEQPGYGATFQALIDGNVDVIHAFSNSSGYVKVAASPAGLRILPVPRDNEEGWKRLKAITPYQFPAVVTDGPTIPEEGIETFASPYPILVTLDQRPADEVYEITKAMVGLHDKFKDVAPGMIGWHIDRQRFSDAMTPFHEGAIRYYREIGAWSEEAQTAQETNRRRTEVLRKAWSEYVQSTTSTGTEFISGWMKQRANALKEAEMNPISETWDVQ